jgi:hypothetical protein
MSLYPMVSQVDARELLRHVRAILRDPLADPSGHAVATAGGLGGRPGLPPPFHNLSFCESRLSFQFTHRRLRDIESRRTKILACDTEFSETTGIADQPRG